MLPAIHLHLPRSNMNEEDIVNVCYESESHEAMIMLRVKRSGRLASLLVFFTDTTVAETPAPTLC